MERNVERVRRSLAWVEAHLGEEITVATVARAAGLSPYHFHRIFTALVGEPLMAYVRARRLTEAARRLARGGARLVDVAFDAGFSSQEGFTRAFRRRFDLPPGRFRREGGGRRDRGREPVTAAELERALSAAGGGSVERVPRFVERPAFAVVGMCCWTTKEAGPREIPRLWERFARRLASVPRRTAAGTCYGVCFGAVDPAPGAEEDYFYLAATEVTDLGEIPADLVGKTIPTARYAVFDHPTGLAGLVAAIAWVWGTWLPSTDLRPSPTPDLEVYDERFDPETGRGTIGIWVPVLT